MSKVNLFTKLNYYNYLKIYGLRSKSLLEDFNKDKLK